MVDPALFGPIDAILAPVASYLVLVLVLANFGTRYLAHRAHVRQAAEGPDAVSRYGLHELTNFLLVFATFYFTTLHQHEGIVLSLLVVGMLLTDFFEFEGRRVEARQDLPIEQPKGAIAASVLVFLYAAYVALFFVIQPVWNAVI